MRLTLPLPPSANRYWRTVRGRMVISREARDFKAEVGYMLNTMGLSPLHGPVRVMVNVYRPTKRGDLDNFLKVTLDSLRGYAYDDDDQITELHAYRHDDKALPRVEVQID